MDDPAAHSGRGIVVLAGEFLADIGYRRYSPRTLEIYRLGLTDFARFLAAGGIREAREVTAPRIEAYRRHLRQRGFSPAGEETYLHGVKRFFGFLEDTQRVFENPFAGLGPVRRERKLMPVPTEAEMQALLAAPNVATARGVRTRAILEVAYSTGARLEELARMRHSDLDLANGAVRILGKGNRERMAPLGAAAIEWVRKYVVEVRARQTRTAGGALWVKALGLPLGSVMIGRLIRECARRAGTVTPITPHGIRRACATHMLNRGAHPVQLQMLLGHTSLKHLSQYLRVSFRELRAIHERSRLGA